MSKRNIIQKKPYVPQPKALGNGNAHNISVNQSGYSNQSQGSTPLRSKDFVIKQKAKREYTNEN